MNYENTENEIYINSSENNLNFDNNTQNIDYIEVKPTATFDNVANDLSFEAPYTNSEGSNLTFNEDYNIRNVNNDIQTFTDTADSIINNEIPAIIICKHKYSKSFIGIPI